MDDHGDRGRNGRRQLLEETYQRFHAACRGANRHDVSAQAGPLHLGSPDESNVFAAGGAGFSAVYAVRIFRIIPLDRAIGIPDVWIGTASLGRAVVSAGRAVRGADRIGGGVSVERGP
jgi:hypothetical protein